MPTEEVLRKMHTNSLRRKADRLGLRLHKTRRRDPRAYDFGGWMVVDRFTGIAVYGYQPHDYSATLDDVERFLEDYRP